MKTQQGLVWNRLPLLLFLLLILEKTPMTLLPNNTDRYRHGKGRAVPCRSWRGWPSASWKWWWSPGRVPHIAFAHKPSDVTDPSQSLTKVFMRSFNAKVYRQRGATGHPLSSDCRNRRGGPQQDKRAIGGHRWQASFNHWRNSEQASVPHHHGDGGDHLQRSTAVGVLSYLLPIPCPHACSTSARPAVTRIATVSSVVALSWGDVSGTADLMF